MIVLTGTPEWMEEFGPYVDTTTEFPWKVSPDIPAKQKKELKDLNKASKEYGYEMFKFLTKEEYRKSLAEDKDYPITFETDEEFERFLKASPKNYNPPGWFPPHTLWPTETRFLIVR